MSHKKIGVYKVGINTTDESVLNFEDIISNQSFQNIDKKIASKSTQLAYVEDKGDYILGMIQTTKMNATPPKRNVVSNIISSLGLDQDEGLLYGNVFLYSKLKKALLYEITRDSLFVGQLDELIYSLVKESELPKFNIRFTPMMKADAMQKLLRMGDKRAIHMQFAHPDELIRKIKNSQSSIKEIAAPAKKIGAEFIDVTYKISSRKDKFLQDAPINKMLEFVGEKFDLIKDNVRKFSIKGYEENEEKITEVDVIKDLMVELINYEEDKNMKDLKVFQRKQQIEAAFLRLTTDLSIY